MKPEDYPHLTQLQRDTLLISMIIRSEMEDFHVKHLSDAQMKQLNPIVRQAVFDALNLIEHIRVKGRKADTTAIKQLHNQISQIPQYWEVPDQVSKGFMQFEPHTLWRTAEWADKPNLKPLHERFLKLGDFKYKLVADEINIATVETFLARSIAPDETNKILRYRAAQQTLDEELKVVVRDMRASGVSQQKLIDARGNLSRSDIRGYF